MPLTVLSDSDVRRLLLSLSRSDIIELQTTLAEALHEYSTGTIDHDCSSSTQPARTCIVGEDGQTTLFMPASSSGTIGVKIVSLSEADACPARNPSPSPRSPRSPQSPRSSLNQSPQTSYKPQSPSPQSRKASKSRSSSSGPGIRFADSPATASFSGLTLSEDSLLKPPVTKTRAVQSTTPHGSITLLDSHGAPLGFLNAEELTAFRTALAVTLMLVRRTHVNTITVFGAGKQAYWHIRLALMLRGEEIRHINIINRTFDRAHKLLEDIYTTGEEKWRATTKFTVLSAEFGEYNRMLKEDVRNADVIFCCTPSTAPLFPAEHLTSVEGRRKGRLVSLIGSYKPHMLEVHPDVLRQAVESNHTRHHHKHAISSGVVVVDSLESCLREAGEVIQADLRPDQLVEVGELIMIKKAVKEEMEAGGKGEAQLTEWLQKGNVIYKSVGLGLMDLVVGNALVVIARQRGVGVTIKNF